MSRSCSAIAKIVNKLGLHARPAMMLVETASKFGSEVKVRRTDSEEAFDGKSIMQMMMLAGTYGTEIEIIADGDDAEDAVKAITELIKSKFEED